MAELGALLPAILDRGLKSRLMNSQNKPDDTIHYGFKGISLTNLTEQDSKTPCPSRLKGEKWVKACLKPQLESCVPEEIAFLFEVAQGSMVYGMFFQPLASLATEQCYRVLEAGARMRCAQVGLPVKKRKKDPRLQKVGFSEILEALTKAGKIPEGDLEYWKSTVFLRNRFSHPTSQTIQSADSPPRILAFTSELLNRLFK